MKATAVVRRSAWGILRLRRGTSSTADSRFENADLPGRRPYDHKVAICIQPKQHHTDSQLSQAVPPEITQSRTITVQCPSCSYENPSTNRFCGMCGAMLESRTPAQ